MQNGFYYKIYVSVEMLRTTDQSRFKNATLALKNARVVDNGLNFDAIINMFNASVIDSNGVKSRDDENVEVVKHNLAEFTLAEFSTLRDSLNYRHNIYSLRLISLTADEYDLITNTENTVIVTIKQNDLVIKELRLKIRKYQSSTSNNSHEIFGAFISEKALGLYTDSDLTIAFNNSKIIDNTTVYEQLYKVLDDYQFHTLVMTPGGKHSQVFKKIHFNIMTNIEFLNNISNTYTPYILKPFIIFDDLESSHTRQSVRDDKGGYLFIFSLVDVSENIPVVKLTKGSLKLFKYIEEKHIIDTASHFKKLEKNIVLLNPKLDSGNQEGIIRSSNRSGGESLNIVSIYDTNNYKKTLAAQTVLAIHPCKYVTYEFNQIPLGAIGFGKNYNISPVQKLSNGKVFVETPVTIEDKFIRTNTNSYQYLNRTTFAHIPDNITSINIGQ